MCMASAWRPEEHLIPGTGLTGSCEASNAGAENQLGSSAGVAGVHNP